MIGAGSRSSRGMAQDDDSDSEEEDDVSILSFHARMTKMKMKIH
jgi:hypothetical protein